MKEPQFERCELCCFYEESGADAYGRGDYKEAQKLFKIAYEIADQCPSEAECRARKMNNLAAVYDVQKRYGDAMPLYKQALRVFKSNHPGLAIVLGNVAGLYYVVGKYEFCEQLYERALRLLRKNTAASNEVIRDGLKNYIVLLRKKNSKKPLEIMDTCTEEILNLILYSQSG